MWTNEIIDKKFSEEERTTIIEAVNAPEEQI